MAWKNDEGYNFIIYPKWRRGGSERRQEKKVPEKRLFKRNAGERRRTFFERLSLLIFPRGFPHINRDTF